MEIKPIHTLTADEIREQGALAAERGEEIYEAEIRSGLDGLGLLCFEAGYFERQDELRVAQARRQGVVCAEPV